MAETTDIRITFGLLYHVPTIHINWQETYDKKGRPVFIAELPIEGTKVIVKSRKYDDYRAWHVFEQNERGEHLMDGASSSWRAMEKAEEIIRGILAREIDRSLPRWMEPVEGVGRSGKNIYPF